MYALIVVETEKPSTQVFTGDYTKVLNKLDTLIQFYQYNNHNISDARNRGDEKRIRMTRGEKHVYLTLHETTPA